MKKLISLYIFFSLFLVGQAQVSTTINITKAGTLGTLLTLAQKNTITNFTVTGSINAIDFKCMRDNMVALSSLDLSNATILYYKGTYGTVNSPDSIEYSSNQIPMYAFYKDGSTGKTSLQSIILPNSITSIGYYAFNNCTGLTCNLIIPDGVTQIEENAFAYCSSLTGSLKIPNSVTTIGNFAFLACSNLNGNLTIGDGVTNIGRYAFSGCNKLNGALVIPNSVTTISECAFFGCEGFKGKLIVGNSVSSIWNSAFNGCTGIDILTLPSSLTLIGSSAFSSCTGLTEIYTNATTPPVDMSDYVFMFLNKSKCTLYVPKGSKSIYQTAMYWKDFTNIVEMTTALKPISHSYIKLFSRKGELIIENVILGDKLKIYNIDGLKIKEQTLNEYSNILSLPTGSYIVKIGNYSSKVIIK